MPTYFLIPGAQKAASTFIHACLAEHPQIYMPLGEVPFFESPYYEQSTPAALQRLFAGRPEPVLGFKRPNYLGRPEVPERVRRHLPAARFIVVLRNPLQRAVSAYFHAVKNGFLPAAPVEQGMAAILDGRGNASHPRVQQILDFGMYHKHLSHWLQQFERERFAIFLYEDVSRDRSGSLRQIYRFLGVDPDYQPANLDHQPQRSAYHPLRLRFAAVRNRIGYRYDTGRTRILARSKAAPGRLLIGIMDGIDRFLLAPILISPQPGLSADLSARLYAVYRQDIQLLQRLLDRDLSHWSPQPHS